MYNISTDFVVNMTLFLIYSPSVKLVNKIYIKHPKGVRY